MFDRKTLGSFSEKLRGRLIQPGDAEYETRRKGWNGMIDRRPAVIARCMGAADVIDSVHFAREHELLVSIKGGGHSVAGKSVCDQGLMIDLSLMKSIRVDLKSRTARVEPGVLLGDLDHETQAFGLATTGGLISKTGVAGLTLGGGIGYLARQFGLTIDNLISADVVTADGALVQTNSAENPDLFWALRGGGGNFGVVASFEFRLHPVGPEVLAAQVFYPIEDASRVLRSYRDLMVDAPDELACYAMVTNLPALPPFPEEFHAKTSIVLVACFCGEIDEGRPLLSSLQRFGNPLFEAIGPMPYTQLQKSFDAGVPDGERYYWKALNFDRISDETIDTFIQYTNPLPGPFSVVAFEPMGGAISRVDPETTAFPDRDAAFSLGIWSGWSDPGMDDEIIEWTRKFHDAMAPHSAGGIYTNYLDQDDDEKVKSVYGEKYDRLQQIKVKYDPDNFFRMNPNIKPRD